MLNQILVAAWLQSAVALPAEQELVEVISARDAVLASTPVSASTLDAGDIGQTAPTHPNELFNRVAGSWISRGSGQESLTAIRSPVLTGAGACGAFLVLEDGVPIRPTGFCNVNELFEVNLAQASQLTVYRGPGSVTEGSNALHGVISVRSIRPEANAGHALRLESGSDEYFRGAVSLRSDSAAFAFNITDAGSFRDDEQYRHAQMNASFSTGWGSADVLTTISWVDLDQDTAGYILGKDAYKDPVLRTENLNPEAYREADAFRLTSQWLWALDSAVIEWIPYARTSDMEFLQHFLPGKPLETNGQDSLGFRLNWLGQDNWAAGLDLEWANGYLVQFQEFALTEGSVFLQETRPQGYHYDYEVDSTAAAIWLRYKYNINDNHIFNAGLRYEFLHYDYKNNMLSGNTRDDGSACGFGGCLYTRPEDRGDHFREFAPHLGLTGTLTKSLGYELRVARGFRAPQATELYRLQRGQTVSDLDSTTLDSVEAGLRFGSGTLEWSATAFFMRKDHYIFRDAGGYNVSDGKTTHKGIEADLSWQLHDDLQLSGNLIWARHEYDFDRLASAGEIIRKGNEIDTAPNWLGSLRLQWRPAPPVWTEAEWVHNGAHFIDAANAHRYGGHSLLNLRAGWQSRGGRHQLMLRLTNLLDRYYAERADFAFGNYRYFPGAERRVFVSWQYFHR